MSLPASAEAPAAALPPVQRKLDPAADPAHAQRSQLTRRWLDTAVRPDIYPPPVTPSMPPPVTPSMESASAGGQVQMRASADQAVPSAGEIHQLASAGTSGASTALPHLDRIQQSFGRHDLSDVRAHVGGPAAEASHGIGAQAYAMGAHVAFRSTPDLHTAAHEAAHVVQQRGGVQLAGGVGQVGDAYEQHADAVADAVVAGASAESLLSQMAPQSGLGSAGNQSRGATSTQMVQRLQAEQLGPDQSCWDNGIQVRITASRLNVRTSPSNSSQANIVGQLVRGQGTDALGREGEWLMVEFGGQIAYIHGGYVETVETAPAPGQGAGDSALVLPVSEQPTTETEPPTAGQANNPQISPQPQAGEVETPATDAATNPVLRLVNDFNNVPVWARGEAPPDHQPSHYQTPYFLNSSTNDVKWSGRGAVNNLIIAQGRAHAGERVGDAIDGSRAWVGKGTPEEMHIIAQAIIDNQHDGQTPSSIQAYVNDGVERAPGRRNGKWGVDCSGFTSQMMHELEGNGRSGFTSTNAESFQHDGARGYTPIDPQTARMGDVLSFESTNHVVVVFAKWDVHLPLAGGDTSSTKPAVMIGVGESGASQDASSGQFVRSDRRFFYFPGATAVMGQSNPAGPAYRLANSRSEELPHWQPALAQVSYTGNSQWTGGFTLNCASDPSGTNIRVREDDGSFTSTSTLVPNGAGGVELQEVEGTMVRIRVDGVDTQNGKTTWAPVAYVASMGEGYSIPSGGQPVDRSPKLYSVVRNPNLDQGEQAAAGQEGQTAAGQEGQP